MKKVIKKNQVMITALVIMIAAAGYISYSDSKLKTTHSTAKKEEANVEDVLQEMEDLDVDLTDETQEQELPGEAVLTGASAYLAEAKINREQIRSQNKETLRDIINNSELSEEERKGAIATMVGMTDLIEKEAAAELLLEAKGFKDVVVNLTGETADIVVPMEEIDDESRAKIEDIVVRKTGIPAENIVISPMNNETE